MSENARERCALWHLAFIGAQVCGNEDLVGGFHPYSPRRQHIDFLHPRGNCHTFYLRRCSVFQPNFSPVSCIVVAELLSLTSSLLFWSWSKGKDNHLYTLSKHLLMIGGRLYWLINVKGYYELWFLECVVCRLTLMSGYCGASPLQEVYSTASFCRERKLKWERDNFSKYTAPPISLSLSCGV